MNIIKPSISNGASSDITNRKINSGVIVINILSIVFRKDEIEEVDEMIIEKIDKENVYVKDNSPSTSCIKCSRENIHVCLCKKNEPVPKVGFCKDCAFEALDEIRKQRDLIENIQKYVDECGFTIIDWSGADKQKTDSVDGSKIGNKTVIVINTNGKDIITKLKNINKLINILKTDNNSKLDEGATKSNHSLRSECGFCGKDKEIYYISGAALCRECKDKLGNKIEKYLEENKEEILSEII